MTLYSSLLVLSMIIDSHCHLNLIDTTKYPNGLHSLIEEAKKAGVSRFLSVSVTMKDAEPLFSIADTFDDVDISIGVHPDASFDEKVTAETLIHYASQHRACVAIGETGLDFYRITEPQEKTLQMARFREHIVAARKTKLPLIIHTREASSETLAMLRDEKASDVGGVMHCFTENFDVAKAAIDLGFYISISGIVTFKNAHIVQEVAKKVPNDRLLVETDAPYLAPVPHRGKPNVPAFIKDTVQFIAELRGVSFEELAGITTENYKNCFKRQNKVKGE